MTNQDGPAGPAMMKEQLDAAQALMAKLDAPVKTVITTMLSGLIASAPGVPAHMILQLAAAHAGLFMGSCIAGELSTVLQIRRSFIASFEEGVKKVPPNVIPTSPPPTGIRG